MVPKVDALLFISLKGQCVIATWVLVTVVLLFFFLKYDSYSFLFHGLFWLGFI